MSKTDEAIRQDLIVWHKMTYCINERCPRRAECLPYRAYQIAPPFLTAQFVDPRRSDTQDCPYFKELSPRTYARGFRKTMGELKSKDKREFQENLQVVFNCCHRLTYRYINGERLISTERQEALRELCSYYGVELRFDGYELSYYG